MRDDNLRNRFKAVSSRHKSYKVKSPEKEDIFSIWDEQKRMRAEDERIERELEETKRRAKELKKTLRKHQLGEVSTKTKTQINKNITLGKKGIGKAYDWITTNRKYVGAAVIVVLLLTISLAFIRADKSEPETLGESTLQVQEELPREKPQFELLYPQGNSDSGYDVVRISPPEAAPSYTYLDRLTEDGAIFRVTQQEIPDNFDLAKSATDFQATSIIQVDDVTVYHGYSERGGIQSLIFEKNGKLISIRSPQKFSDDAWASYVASLK